MKRTNYLVTFIFLLAIIIACGGQETPAPPGAFATITPGGEQATPIPPTLEAIAMLIPQTTATSATEATIMPTPQATATSATVVQATSSPVPAPTPTPQRIRFAAGTTSATVSGLLPVSARKQYVLRALAGQIMTVEPSAITGAFQISIQQSNGAVLGSANAPTTWSGKLPATDDYIITLQAPVDAGNTNYSLLISIVYDIPPTPEAVKAVINGPTRGQMGQSLTYNSYGSSGPIAGVVWDFGDDSPAIYDAQEVTYVYNAPGTYRLALMVYGEHIGTGSDTAVMYVVIDPAPEPERVKAVINGPTTGQVGQSLTFNSYGSSGPIASSVWDFGDDAGLVYDAPQVAHIFNAPGTYRVTLSVQGEHIGSGSDTAVLDVEIWEAQPK